MPLWDGAAVRVNLPFSARLYGSCSRKNQKLLDGVKKAVEEAQA